VVDYNFNFNNMDNIQQKGIDAFVKGMNTPVPGHIYCLDRDHQRDFLIQNPSEIKAFRFECVFDFTVRRYTRQFLWKNTDPISLSDFLKKMENTPFPCGELGERGTIWFEDGSWTQSSGVGNNKWVAHPVCPSIPE